MRATLFGVALGSRPVAPGCSPAQVALLAWGEAHRRDLPWRRTRDPWAVLVSELMLQQTQVARVVPRYHRVPRPVPDAGRRARRRRVGDVVRAWAGLGYNRRAVNLHRAAVAVVDRHGGELPATSPRSVALPGVGPYTARAVLAFAFGDDVGVVEVNTARVLARAFAGRRLAPAEAQAMADGLVPAGAGLGVEPGDDRPGRHACARSRSARPARLRPLPAGADLRLGRGRGGRRPTLRWARPGPAAGSRPSPAPTARAAAGWSTPSAGARWRRPTRPRPPAGPTTRTGPAGWPRSLVADGLATLDGASGVLRLP